MCGLLVLKQQEGEEMLVPHTEIVQGPLEFDGTPPVEGPRPMEGLWFTFVC